MNHSIRQVSRAISCTVLFILSACQQQAPAPSTPPGSPPPPLPPVTREIQLTVGRYLQQCPNLLLRFPYNESEPLAQDTPDLEGLAACLNSSPYRTVRLRLIGRTDGEGSDDYNQKLGLRRAEYVKAALVRHGVDAGRIDTESAGAAAAGEGAPGYDRRVDVVQLVAITPI